jgi:hypothetical protein
VLSYFYAEKGRLPSLIEFKAAWESEIKRGDVLEPFDPDQNVAYSIRKLPSGNMRLYISLTSPDGERSERSFIFEPGTGMD